MTLQQLGILMAKHNKKMALNYSEGQYHAYAFDPGGDQRLAAYGRGDDIEEAVESLVEKVQ